MIFSLALDVSLLFDGIKKLAGDPEFEVRLGPAPMLSDCCGRAEYTAHSVRQKNMVCKRGGNASNRYQDGKPFPREPKASSISSREGLNKCRNCAYESRTPYKRRDAISNLEIYPRSDAPISGKPLVKGFPSPPALVPPNATLLLPFIGNIVLADCDFGLPRATNMLAQHPHAFLLLIATDLVWDI